MVRKALRGYGQVDRCRIHRTSDGFSPGAHGGCDNGDQQEQNDNANTDADTVRVQVHVSLQNQLPRFCR
jgi:hypothetical protein